MPNATLAPDPVSPTITTGRILIIDDEPGIRESLEVLLTLEGFDVDMAPEGSTGLDMLASGEYDLLLLDLALPGESGIDLLPRIKRIRPQLPVIMITGLWHRGQRGRRAARGCGQLRPKAMGQ